MRFFLLSWSLIPILSALKKPVLPCVEDPALHHWGELSSSTWRQKKPIAPGLTWKICRQRQWWEFLELFFLLQRNKYMRGGRKKRGHKNLCVKRVLLKNILLQQDKSGYLQKCIFHGLDVCQCVTDAWPRTFVLVCLFFSGCSLAAQRCEYWWCWYMLKIRICP